MADPRGVTFSAGLTSRPFWHHAHTCLNSVALDQQPQVLTMQRSAVVLRVAVELGQWLAGGRAPER